MLDFATDRLIIIKKNSLYLSLDNDLFVIVSNQVLLNETSCENSIVVAGREQWKT